ncbi:ATP-binding cassette domain-containing protein [Paenibacillus sp. ACRSA]|uniref:methionine ABC transporter ATP-binding protein n=1 Tax=Paenibacillus sp. ACRSA TaxID=2918211 RepID=UPI001EF46BCD|nr:ATP-binding cassette domain-containing protein [Paenibacillus sp. ACRSA]MCG7377884.1 ATP-binding cassette domain-containing protein [Paenibacillus sp. ACRSA]
MISLYGVSKRYYERGERADQWFEALSSVSLEIGQGKIHGIIGASGAGKSTLLRLLNGLEKPDEGDVLVNGQNLTGMSEQHLRLARQSIGMIFQHFNLVSNRTVIGNVCMPLELAGGLSRSERTVRGMEVLRFVGLEDKAKQYPAQLSGGQKQRVAIARALASRPSVLLCDEPTSSLDPQTTSGLLDVLRHINQTLGVTIVVVTHEMEVARRLCHQISVMREGRIIRTLSEAEVNSIPEPQPDMLTSLLLHDEAESKPEWTGSVSGHTEQGGRKHDT